MTDGALFTRCRQSKGALSHRRGNFSRHGVLPMATRGLKKKRKKSTTKQTLREFSRMPEVAERVSRFQLCDSYSFNRSDGIETNSVRYSRHESVRMC